MPACTLMTSFSLPTFARVRQYIFLAAATALFGACDPAYDTECLEPDCADDEFRWTEGRREFVDISCVDTDDPAGYECYGLWEDSTAWSRVYLYYTDIAPLPKVNPYTVWSCDTTPDVDVCVIVDQQGHKACFRNELGWAVAVVPMCATSGANWRYVGNGMDAYIAYFE